MNKINTHANPQDTLMAAMGKVVVSAEELEIQQIITLQFYECLTKDRMHALPIYINLLMVREHSKH